MSLVKKKGGLEGNQATLEGRQGPRDSRCYFCDEMFELGKLQNHLKECGSILEQCPLRCGAWIQRKHRDTHVRDCPQMEKSRKTPTYDKAWSPEPPVHTWTPQTDDRVARLEKEVDAIKLALAEESSNRDLQVTEVENLRSKLVLIEEKSHHFLSTLVNTRATVDDEVERTSGWAAQVRHDLANVQLALQDLQNEQLNTAMRLESATNQLVHEQHERELLEQALTHQDTRIRAVNKLEEVIAYIRQTVDEERERNAENRAALEAELVEARRSSQHILQLSELREQLQNASAMDKRPAFDRLAILEVATADARAESSELAAKMDIVSRDMRALAKSYHKLRSELADFQSRVNFERFETGSDNGQFLWRIDKFLARMKEAKEHDTVITSPHFRTAKYGYTLKAEVNLNGIGRWKGRHITCTVRLVGGPYDSLLAWPCELNVNIVLKDQPANRSQAMDIVKTLQVRRKSSAKLDCDTDDDDKTKSTETLDKSVVQLKRQYIFIPHTSLDKLEYVKNDVMFMEFIVNQ